MKKFLDLIADVGITTMLSQTFDEVIIRCPEKSIRSSIDFSFMLLYYHFYVSLLSIMNRCSISYTSDSATDFIVLRSAFMSSNSEDLKHLSQWGMLAWDQLLENLNVFQYAQRDDLLGMEQEGISEIVSYWSACMTTLGQLILYEEFNKTDAHMSGGSSYVESVTFSQLPLTASELLKSASVHLIALLNALDDDYSGNLGELIVTAFWRIMVTLKGYAFVSENLSSIVTQIVNRSRFRIIKDVTELMLEDSSQLNLLSACILLKLLHMESLRRVDHASERVITVFDRLFSQSLHGIMDSQLLPRILHWLPVVIQRYIFDGKRSTSDSFVDTRITFQILQSAHPCPTPSYLYLSKLYASILADLAEMEVHDRSSQYSQHSTQTMDTMISGIRTLVILPLQCLVHRPYWLSALLNDHKMISAWLKLLKVWLNMDKEVNIIDVLSIISTEYDVLSSCTSPMVILSIRVINLVLELLCDHYSSTSKVLHHFMGLISVAFIQSLIILAFFLSEEDICMIYLDEFALDMVLRSVSRLETINKTLMRLLISFVNQEIEGSEGDSINGSVVTYYLFFHLLGKLFSMKEKFNSADALDRWVYALLLSLSKHFSDIPNSTKLFVQTFLCSFCEKASGNSSIESSSAGYLVQFWHQHFGPNTLPAALLKHGTLRKKRASISSELQSKRIKSSYVVVETSHIRNPCEYHGASKLKSLYKGEAETQSQSHSIPTDGICDGKEEHEAKSTTAISPFDSRSALLSRGSIAEVEMDTEDTIAERKDQTIALESIIRTLNQANACLLNENKTEHKKGLNGLTDALVSLAELQRGMLKVHGILSPESP